VDPQMLPDGTTMLFTLANGGAAAAWDQAQIVAHSLDTGERTTLITGGTDARYVATGHIVYALRGTLLAVPFDAASRQVTGGPVPVVEDVREGVNTGTAHFSVSADGTLSYVGGISAEAARRTLIWVDRQGREEPIGAPPRPYFYPRLSPDGTQIALDITDENRDIWVWDLARRTLTRLTSDLAADRAPVWTSDGRRIIFSSDRDGVSNLYWQPANGTTDAERLTKSPNTHNASAVTPDGTRVVLHEATASDISLMILAFAGSRQLQPLVQNSFVNENAAISPDGRWLAYESNASGQDEIYVRPFPDVAGGQWQISTAGGEQALWARNGRELFYREPEGAVMAVPVDAGGAFNTSPPKRLIDGGYYSGTAGPRSAWRTYDVSPDGRRFLMIKNPEQSQQTADTQRIVIVQNWFEELKRRVPVP
jgi:serine/threonine-protein kinase